MSCALSYSKMCVKVSVRAFKCHICKYSLCKIMYYFYIACARSCIAEASRGAPRCLQAPIFDVVAFDEQVTVWYGSIDSCICRLFATLVGTFRTDATCWDFALIIRRSPCACECVLSDMRLLCLRAPTNWAGTCLQAGVFDVVTWVSLFWSC